MTIDSFWNDIDMKSHSLGFVNLMLVAIARDSLKVFFSENVVQDKGLLLVIALRGFFPLNVHL